MNDDHKQPPETIKEIGIHLGYLREDISDLKSTIKDFSVLATTRGETETIKTKVTSIEKRVTALETFLDGLTKRIAGGAISLLVLMVLALYGLDKL